VQEIDGHDVRAILTALERARAAHGEPSVLIAHTIKGKGVRFMEDVPHWHGSVKLTPAQAEDSLAAIGVPDREISRWLDGAR
jgi:transketolase